MHKFYVSLTEIRIIPEKNSIQVSMRIFPDDLDYALEKKYGTNPQLATELEHKYADLWAEDYIRENFSIEINDTPLPFEYIGKEPEADAIWFYIEAVYDGIPDNIEIKNSILMDFFDDQKNIIQVYFKDYNKSLLLSKDRISGKLVINSIKN